MTVTNVKSASKEEKTAKCQEKSCQREAKQRFGSYVIKGFSAFYATAENNLG